MKNILLCLGVFLILMTSGKITAQVKVGNNYTNIDDSAIFELESTNQGFLLPRLSTDQRNTINKPATGLIIYNTSKKCIELNIGTPDEANWDCIKMELLGCNPDFRTAIVEVTSTTGKVWMDRNLGASQAATSSSDSLSFGDLYQWGRSNDGHQCRDSDTLFTEATTAVPDLDNTWDGKFIIGLSPDYNWLDTEDNTLWQGVSGSNNPCPFGFRIPTKTEWDAEITSFSTADLDGAFGSVLKIPAGGYRDSSSGAIAETGNEAKFFSSTIVPSENKSYGSSISSSGASTVSANRGEGLSIRCIKE